MALFLTHNEGDKIFVEGRGKKLELVVSKVYADSDQYSYAADILVKDQDSYTEYYLVDEYGPVLLFDDFEMGVSDHQTCEYWKIQLYYAAPRDYDIIRENAVRRKHSI